MNKIINTLFEDCLSRIWHFERYEIVEFAERVRVKLGISRETLAKSVLDLIADKDFDLIAYSLKKEFITDEAFTKKDVIIELKVYLWSYLFPENEFNAQEKSLVFDLMQVFYKNHYDTGGWFLNSDLFSIISKLTGKDFYDIDFFIEQLFFAGKTESKSNEGIDRNGFNKNNSSTRWKSIDDNTLAKFPSEALGFA